MFICILNMVLLKFCLLLTTAVVIHLTFLLAPYQQNFCPQTELFLRRLIHQGQYHSKIKLFTSTCRIGVNFIEINDYFRAKAWFCLLKFKPPKERKVGQYYSCVIIGNVKLKKMGVIFQTKDLGKFERSR